MCSLSYALQQKSWEVHYEQKMPSLFLRADNGTKKWLNKMAENGYRLIHTKRMLYEFQECTPKLVEYRVDFIGQKSQVKARDYHNFLEDMGYKAFYKNINLNYSIGKVRYRPWAEEGGRIAANF